MQPHTENSRPAHSAIIARDIKAEMVAFMRGRGDCTREDLLQQFTPKQIDQYATAAAREANRRANRRVF